MIFGCYRKSSSEIRKLFKVSFKQNRKNITEVNNKIIKGNNNYVIIT